jgi:hypothetical protein
VELYGASEIDGLYEALKRLDWDVDRLRSPDRGLVSWITQMRMYGSEGNFNLGSIHRKGEKRFMPADRTAPLPDGIDYMHGYVYQVSPSLTAIVLCFVPKEAETGAYTTVLNTDQRTTNERNSRSRGYRIIDVIRAKERAAKLVRSHLRSLVAQWFKENIPGFFSLRGATDRLPMAELLITRRQQLLHGAVERTEEEARWVSIVRRPGFREVWKLKGINGLSLTWDEVEDTSRFHTLINLQTELLGEESLKHYGERGVRTYAAFVSEQTEGVLIHLGVIAGLLEVLRGLRQTRDTFPKESRSHKQVLQALKQIRELFENSVGLPSITYEMAARAENDRSFRWLCEEFVSEPWRPNETAMNIAEALRTRTHYLASRALAQERETREHFEQISGILNTQESVRAQKRMEVLTVVTTVLATASLLVALLSIDRIAKSANALVEQFFGAK